MKGSKYRFSYRKNASKLHKIVGEALRNSSKFKGYKIYQEYPVSDICSSYKNHSHKFDWVILDLKIVIEVHGEQHYKEVDFGGEGQEKAADRLSSVRHRDRVKMDAAIEAGFTYIEIPYSDIKKVDEDYIWCLYRSCYNPELGSLEEKEEDLYREERLNRARAWRRKKYLQTKEYKQKLKEAEDDLSDS